MPRISSFLGIAIYMYFSEHGIAHFHAIYGQYEAVIGIDPIRCSGWQIAKAGAISSF
jgi:hypothetical protein